MRDLVKARPAFPLVPAGATLELFCRPVLRSPARPTLAYALLLAARVTLVLFLMSMGTQRVYASRPEEEGSGDA